MRGGISCQRGPVGVGFPPTPALEVAAPRFLPPRCACGLGLPGRGVLWNIRTGLCNPMAACGAWDAERVCLFGGSGRVKLSPKPAASAGVPGQQSPRPPRVKQSGKRPAWRPRLKVIYGRRSPRRAP